MYISFLPHSGTRLNALNISFFIHIRIIVLCFVNCSCQIQTDIVLQIGKHPQCMSKIYSSVSIIIACLLINELYTYGNIYVTEILI